MVRAGLPGGISPTVERQRRFLSLGGGETLLSRCPRLSSIPEARGAQAVLRPNRRMPAAPSEDEDPCMPAAPSEDKDLLSPCQYHLENRPSGSFLTPTLTH